MSLERVRSGSGSDSGNRDLDEVSHMIDGRTGIEYTVEEFQAMESAENARRKAGRFIKGPLPISTIAAAKAESPAALETALALFFMHGLCGKERFKAGPARFDELGISRKSRQRGLQALEEIGLIALDRKPGSAIEVTLLAPFFGRKASD